MLIITILIIFNIFMINKVLSRVDNEVFTISTKGCTIRGFPWINEYIRTLVLPPSLVNKCKENNNQLVESNKTHIWVTNDEIEFINFNIRVTSEFYCCYRNFWSEDNIKNIKYSKCIEFTRVIRAKHPFVRIECFYNGDKVYDDFFVFTNIKHKEQEEQQESKMDGYNVLILGIESMSRMNFHRTMNKTSEYLYLKGAIELLGYNKLGDNSFPNLFPLLFGKSFEHVKEQCFKNYAFNFEDCSFIWDKFKQAGYHTALGSDSIVGLLQDYEYNLTRAPTDYYLQPFIFEARHLFRDQNYNYHHCLGSRYFYKIFLDYIEGITSKNLHKLFGFFWAESISHDDLNGPYRMDLDYLNMLFNYEENSFLNETVLIFLGDHGMRWGTFAQTEQGRLEDRLPLLTVLFPDSFKRRYSQAYANFKQNSRRLTTPYDMYETLNDLLYPSSLENNIINERSIAHNSLNRSSLFLSVSDMRTCESVGIKQHWCTCYKGKKLRIKNKNRKLAAKALISHINQLLKLHTKCHRLKLNNILQVNMVQSDKVRIYTVVLETIPGYGIFDGTLHKERNTWTVSGTVSRLNLYRNQTCIDDDLVKMYCYCKL